MLRLHHPRLHGWHSLAAGEHAALLHEHLVDSCQDLNATELPLSTPCSTHASERTVRGVSVSSEFTFVKVDGSDMLGTEAVDAHLSTGTVYAAPHGSTITVFGEGGSCVVATPAGAERVPLASVVTRRRATFLSLPPPPGTAGPHRRVRCQKLARARRARFLVYVHRDVTRVKFVVHAEQKRSALRTAPLPPVCVNACYSAYLVGAIRAGPTTDAFRSSAGATGTIMCLPGALGNVNVYPARGGRHKVSTWVTELGVGRGVFCFFLPGHDLSVDGLGDLQGLPPARLGARRARPRLPRHRHDLAARRRDADDCV